MFEPRHIARALGPAVPIALAILGLAVAVFDLLLVRPGYLEFSKHGRPAIGVVRISVPFEAEQEIPARLRPPYSIVAVHDADLGLRTVELSDARPVGERVPVLCLTSARRCESAERVASYIASWPFTTGTIAAAAAIALALLLAIVLARARQTGR